MKLNNENILAIAAIATLASIGLLGGNGILVFIVSVILLLILRQIIKKSAKDIKIIERWGEYIPSKSGITWAIPRTHSDWDRDSKKRKIEDSRHLLVSFGFSILGITDEVLYSVEPPLGWKHEAVNNLHSYIRDEKGEKRFYVFLKNDIMNPSDYRGYISEKVD